MPARRPCRVVPPANLFPIQCILNTCCQAFGQKYVARFSKSRILVLDFVTYTQHVVSKIPMKLMMVTHCSVIRLGRGCVAAGRMVVVSGSFKVGSVLQSIAFPHFMCIHLINTPGLRTICGCSEPRRWQSPRGRPSTCLRTYTDFSMKHFTYCVHVPYTGHASESLNCYGTHGRHADAHGTAPPPCVRAICNRNERTTFMHAASCTRCDTSGT